MKNQTITIAYHITSEKNIDSILKGGLLLNKTEDTFYEEMEGIFLFKTKQDQEDGLTNWLGERIEEIEEETGVSYNETSILVNISDLNVIERKWELICLEPIPPERILVVEKVH